MSGVESSFKNMTISLLAITLVASAGLGLVYKSTRDPSAAAQVAKVNNAIKAVVPEFDNQPSNEAYTVKADGDDLFFYPASKNGQLVGVAVKTFSNNGFGGRIELMVGFLPD